MKLSLKRNNFKTASATLILAVGALLSLCHSNIYGDIFITATESEGGVTVRWAGSLDVTNLEPAGIGIAPQGSIFPKMGMLSGSTRKKVDVYYFDQLKLRPYGNGGGTLETKGKGDCLLLTNTAENSGLCVCVPSGYSGGPIEGEITFECASLSSLGIDTNYPFVYDLGGQCISFFSNPEVFKKSDERPASLAQVLPSQDQKIEINRFIFRKKPKSRKFRIPTNEVPMVKVRPLSNR